MLLSAVLCGVPVLAQPFLITEPDATTCQGAFLDSGGQGATGYGDDEDETYTLCPGTPGALSSVNFVTADFSLAGSVPLDNLTIYDGNTTGAPLLGSFLGGELQGQTISASEANGTGCLTFVWHSNEIGSGVFAGTIHCHVPCVAPVAAAVMGEAAPAQVCIGEPVTFNGASSTVQPGFAITNWEWDFNDGSSSSANTPNATHAFNAAGVYRVQLTVTDNNGCSSENRLDLQVHVGTAPDFQGTTAPGPGCLGEPLCLTGVVNPTPFLDEPATTYGEGVFIPDDVGSCFEAELYLTQFAPGTTLTNIGQLWGLCMNFEHTWLGDLVITITSPSGQSVILHQQGITSEVWMGDAIDNDENDPQPGTCATYCFANSSLNGTMAQAVNSGGGGGPGTLPPATYQSLYPLSGLVGSQLNGLWTLTVCDLWALDNGFICDWSLDLDPTLYTNIIGYTPTFGAGCDSTWWTGPAITSTEADCEVVCVEPAAAGTYDYTYHAVDDLGCAFDTTVQITVVPPPLVDAGAASAVCAGEATQLGGSVLSGGLEQVPFVYSWQASTGSDPAAISSPSVQPETTTTYTLTVSQTDHPLCQGTDQVVVDVAAQPWAGVGGAIIVCDDAEDMALFPQLTQDPAVGGTWSAPDGTLHTGVFDPQTDAAGTYSYVVPAMAPCAVPAISTFELSVIEAPFAGEDATTTLCSDGQALNLSSVLTGADPGGFWRDGTGAVFSGTYLPGEGQTGPFTYIRNGTSPCPNDTSNVIVMERIAVDAGTDAIVQHCSNQGAIALFAMLNGTPDAEGTWYAPSDAPFGGQFDPATHVPGAYTYVVEADAPCTNDTSTVIVGLSSLDVSAEVLQDATCADWCDGAARRAIVGGVVPVQTLWADNAAVENDSIAVDLCAGVYQVLIIDAWSCRDSAVFSIEEPTPLTLDLIGTVDERCIGTCDGMIVISDPEATLFSFDGGTTWTASNVLGGLCPDTLSMAIRDASGCQAQAYAIIGSPDPVIADFSADRSTVNVSESTVHFSDLSSSAVLYEWAFGTVGSSVEPSPAFTFPAVFGDEYQVCLKVFDQFGCADSLCRVIIVEDIPQLHVPNAFSPNGDGINDRFAPVIDLPALVGSYQFMVFDRWGELIHASETTNASWNGEYREVPVPPDVYVWKLYGKDLVTGAPIEYIGHVTVVR